MLCKYRGLQEPLQFRDFMEVQVGTLARKPVRARYRFTAMLRLCKLRVSLPVRLAVMCL